jgi:hypothetical protein
MAEFGVPLEIEEEDDDLFKPRREVLISELPLPIRGFPGYRTRAGRTGLDLIDTQAVWAHMQGLFIRLLFRRELCPRRWWLHSLMNGVGLICLLPLFFLLFNEFDWTIIYLLVAFAPIITLGVLLLINANG